MSIIQTGKTFNIADVTATFPNLPPGNFLLRQDQHGNFFLQKKEDFVLPKKVYGDTSITQRWWRSFKANSEKNLGIILSGTKGSGKTITCQKFCMETNLPVVIINDAFHGGNFIDFLTSAELGECIIFIDEFEKVYNRQEESVDLLSLMDGTYPTKLIFLLTCNEYRISSYLINRLNRIKYRQHYVDLDDKTINEVLDDMLVNQDHRESVFKFFEKVNLRTFDLLVNIIKEMNLFNEDAITCGNYLNLQSEDKFYEVTEIIDEDNSEYPCHGMSANPAQTTFCIERKTLDYVKKLPSFAAAKAAKDGPDVLVDEEEEDYYNAEELGHSWNVELEIAECIKTRLNNKSFILVDNKRKLKFKFKEGSQYMYMF